MAKAVALIAAAALVLLESASTAVPRRLVAPLRVSSVVHARFVQTPPPASRGPGLGAEHLVFLDARIGFAATTGGAGWVPKTGWHRPSEPGRIQATANGGASWRTLWSHRRVVFDSIAFFGHRDGVAVANIVPRGVRDYGPEPPARPLALATHDSGRTWHPVRAPFAHLLGRIDPVGPSTWFAVIEGPSYAGGAAPRLRRTDDGGRSWAALPLPRHAEAVRFATPSLGFAGAAGSSCPRRSQLWRSRDGGHTWRAVPGTCGATYADIDVVTPRLVFTAESYESDGAASRMNLLRRSRDSGRTWKVVPSDPRQRWPALFQVAFADPSHGWAVSHETDQGFVFDALHVTVDGGRTWQARPFPTLPTAFAGTRYAWTGDEGVWRTSDGGRSWTVSVRPRRLGAYELEFATRTTLAVTTLGAAWSRDAGRTWSFRHRVTPREAARATGTIAYLDVRDLDVMGAFVTADHGRTWRRLRVPRRYTHFLGDVAFTDPQRGLLAAGQGDFGRVPVLATADGGKSWRRVRMPPNVHRDYEANLGPGVIVLPNALDPPRVNLAALSVDEGSHWQTFPLKADFWDCDAARPSPETIWVSCSQNVSKGASVHLISHDGGKSWLKLVAAAQLDEHVAVVGDHEAWTIGAPYGRSPGTLWHTVDDGRTWRRVWVHVSPRARYFEMQGSPVMG